MPITNFEILSYDDTHTHPRYILDNQINSGNLTCDHNSVGWTSFPQATKIGNARMTTSISYPGVTECEYIVEIDSVAAGHTIGYATFRWGKQYLDGSGLTYLGFGVLTTDHGYEIESGLSLNFYPGITSPDFLPRDRWTFKGIKQHGIDKLIGFDRSDYFTPSFVDGFLEFIVDFSNESTLPKVSSLIIFDHNFTEATNITYTVGSTVYEANLHSREKDIFYFNEIQYPLHTISIDYSAELPGLTTPKIGKIHLGKWVTLVRGRDPQYLRSRIVAGDTADLRNRWVDDDAEHIEFTYPLLEGFTESEDVELMVNTIRASSVVRGAPQKPIFFHFNPTIFYDFSLYFIDNVDTQLTGIFRNLFNAPVRLTEVAK